MRKQQEASMKGISGRVRFSSTSFFIWLAFWSVAADAQMIVHFDLPSQPLARSLTAIGTATNTNVGFTASQVAGLLAPPLKADLTVDDALTRVLVGTGLRSQRLDDHTIVIAAKEASTTGAAEVTVPTMKGPARTASDDPITTPQGTLRSDSTNEPASSSARKQDDIEEIVVTGTHIAGGAPIGSPLIVVSDVDIAHSGYSTIGDVIRSLPQSFGGGVNPGVVGASGNQNGNNISSASTVNLRGLGPDSTLTLINGHRIAYDGFANASDISIIPLAAIQRVEILTDSASAIYGSDAVGGVANFILKEDFKGAETTGRVGTATRGGATEDQFSQLLGTTWSTGSALLTYEHYGQRELYSTDRSFSFDAQGPTSLLPYQKRDSVFADARANIGATSSVYIDGLYSDRKANSAIYAGGGSSYNFDKTALYSVLSGIRSRVVYDWDVALDADWSASRNDVPYSYVAAGASTIPPLTPEFFANRHYSIEAHADGPILHLPAGLVRAAFGVGYRHETYSDIYDDVGKRGVKYAYGELRVPVVQPDSARVGIERLELSIAGRHEKYTDFGSTTTPKIGLSYSPIRSLALRSTWGKSFRAPSLLDLYGGSEVNPYDAVVFGGTAPAQVLYNSGYNTKLQPENAKTWSLGVDIKPEALHDLTSTITYFNINYKGRILQPITNAAVALTDPTYTPFIQRNPSLAQQAAVISQANLYYDYTSTGYDPSKVIAIINEQYQNAAGQKIDGVDMGADYRFEAASGDFGVTGNIAWMRLREQLTITSPAITLSGVIFNPPKVRARVGMNWHKAAWSASSFLNFTSAEVDNSALADVPISSWTTVDAQLSYQVPAHAGLLAGIRVSIAAQNLFDRDPPSVPATSTFISGLRYDSTNASPLGRFISLTITKLW
jgi:iron complex outermembrane receptor protein